MKLAISILLTLAAITAYAGTPLQIQHQGYLLDGADQPVDGPVTLTFQLYADSVGGSALWSETHTNVPVAGGLYTVALGSSTPLTDALFGQPQLWLGTRVNNDSEMVPRIRISSVPYSLLARRLESFSADNLAQFLQLLNSTPDADGDGHTKLSAGGDDCDDLDPAVHPGAPEICDGKDNDCDGALDEGFTTHWYVDADADGFGNPSVAVLSCTPLNGYVNNGNDCDDTNPQINPAAGEVCDGIDNNCNGMIDENPVDGSMWYGDFDGDGYGNPLNGVLACTSPPGYVANNTDCDDSNPSLHPGASEYCNGMDDDCDGQIDEDPVNALLWYPDADGDGYGAGSGGITDCTQPPGYVSNWFDCDDAHAESHPGATEVCDGLDNNCDGQVDEGIGSTWYQDADGDGFGNPNNSLDACIQPAGYVSNNTDCNDGSASIHPGATETCNGVDDDCDGLVDEGVGLIWYRDADNDGFGNPNNTVVACTAPAGYVNQPGDCNDTNANVHPGAIEICNGIDDDCDGQIDEGSSCPVGFHCAAGACVPN